MMNYFRCPLGTIKLLFYFLFGRVFGKLLFKKIDFNTKWFFKVDSPGWQWVWQGFIWQKIFGINRWTPWPVSHRIIVAGANNVIFDLDDLNNFQMMGNYYQGCGKIIIGKGCYIAPNVGLITQNHDIVNLEKREKAQDIVLGANCWIGMNSMILPGVELGDGTIVGAGSVVTKSFVAGNCVIAGNPAKMIKSINR